MIDIVIYKDANFYRGYRVEGHSDYADYGSDIVCASVSILVQATTNGLGEILKAELNFKQASGGYAKLIIRDEDAAISEKASLLLETMMHGLRGIATLYPGHVKIAVEEVKS